jgi:putative tryptophan/tyrosine transport system permease protein
MDFYTTAIAQGLGFVALAIGIFISMRVLNLPDITTDGSFTLGAAVTSVMLTHDYNTYATIIASVVCGALAGMLTGIIHTRMRVNALLSGIIVMTGLYSINLVIMGRPNIPLIGLTTVFDSIKLCDDIFINRMVIFLIIAVVLLLFVNWLLTTDFGIAMRAIGNNETMLRANGVNTQRMKITGLAIANSFTALSGCLIAQYQGFADINMGIGIVISGLGAVMIGEALMSLIGTEKIIFRITGVIIGAVFFRLILGVALSLGLDPNYLKAVTAIIVLLVVGLAGIRKRELT